MVALLALLVSCASGGAGKANDEEMKNEAEMTTVDDSTSEAEEGIDFSSVSVSGHLFAKEGESLSALDEALGADIYASSKGSVATVNENGEIAALKKGVTLIGYERGGETAAFVLCVFGEGEGRDRSAGIPQLFEKGEEFTLVTAVSVTEYSSSDSAVADVSEAPLLSFGECGYAVVTASNVSRPFFYSFIVYDRTVE